MDNQYWKSGGITPILDLPGWGFGTWQDGEFCTSNIVRMITTHGVQPIAMRGCSDDLLLVFVEKDDSGEDWKVSWLLLERIASDGETEWFNFVMTGYGYSAALREPRHTYFRTYQFYVRPALLQAAFTALSRWFDFE
jgi:hypothetical protein